MNGDFTDKSAARQWVWDRLAAEGVARFPFPPHGRIPNFASAELAAARLLDIEPWKSAGAIKVNPDSPQRPLRAEALRRGITVFVPTPRLRGGFNKLDPRRIPPDKIDEAASLSRGDRWSEEVALADMPRLDAIVCGSVAVTRDGRRCGKGEGYSDLEFAILRELGHPPVPVATTVHDLQVVDTRSVEQRAPDADGLGWRRDHTERLIGGVTGHRVHNLQIVHGRGDGHRRVTELAQDGEFQVAVAFALATAPPIARDRGGAADDGVEPRHVREGYLLRPTVAV
jgi:5-formyltetrahydrofolate cyclo-ligase